MNKRRGLMRKQSMLIYGRKESCCMHARVGDGKIGDGVPDDEDDDHEVLGLMRVANRVGGRQR